MMIYDHMYNAEYKTWMTGFDRKPDINLRGTPIQESRQCYSVDIQAIWTLIARE